MATLIKINTDHYVVVDDSEIKDGDHYINIEPGNPFFGKIYKGMNRILKEGYSGNGYKNPDYFKTWMKKITHSTNIDWNEVYYIPLSEVKELIGEVDVEKKVKEYYEKDTTLNNPSSFKAGYNQAIEDNKEKKYTENDIQNAIKYGFNLNPQPKTEWEVEIVDGKLKLK